MAEDEPATNINVQSVNISPPPEFNPDSEVGASLATRWITWMEDFEMFLTASGIKDDTQKRALLLYQAGSRVREIFRQLTDTGNADDYKMAKDKLRDYFEPQKNRRYEVFKFRQAKQEPNETLDQFHTRLRALAQTCSFNDTEFEIEQQIIINGISSRIRKKALREPDYDLKKILLDGRRTEQSEFQARDIESKDDKMDNIQQVQTKTCHYCGEHIHTKARAQQKARNAENAANWITSRRFVVENNFRNLHTRNTSATKESTKSRSIQFNKLIAIRTVQRTIYTL